MELQVLRRGELVDHGDEVNTRFFLDFVLLMGYRKHQDFEFSSQVEELCDHIELMVEFSLVLVVQITLILGYVGVDLDEDGDQEVHHDDHDDELVQGPGNPDEANDGAVLDLE